MKRLEWVLIWVTVITLVVGCSRSVQENDVNKTDLEQLTTTVQSLSNDINAIDTEKTDNSIAIQQVEKRMIEFFVAVDSSDWDTVLDVFAEDVDQDYSSMTGQAGSVVKAADLVEGWKGFLPGFEHTHHQLGNIIIDVDGDNATVFSYVIASHYLNNENSNVWTVVGTYNIDLEFIDQEWRITKIKLNYKYQDGNTNLPQLAIEAAAK